MTQRDINLSDGSRWTLAQAFSEGDLGAEAAAALADGDGVRVIATPSGGEQTVALSLPPDWSDLPDEELVDALEAER
jgi:hypothetical protein